MSNANKRAVIINSLWMRGQLRNHIFKSEKKYPLDDFWWVFFKLNPDVHSATAKVSGKFPEWVYYVEINKIKEIVT
jgi:hypothetical protein